MGRGFSGIGVKTISRKALVAALLATTTIAGSIAIATAASAQVQTTFNIPGGPLSQVLAAFGRQSGTQISYDSAIASGKTSPGMQGAASREQALRRILQGSGLVYSLSDARNVLITQPISTTVGSGSIPADGSLLLDPIDVNGGGDRNAASGSGFQGTPDWVYQAPAAVSVISRQAIEGNPSRNIRDLLDNVAGVYANRAGAQNPGVTVNVRGLQDQDRIATMIDGARQNFQRAGHGGSQRVYVDSAFLRQIDVEKSTIAGVGSAGALGGLVNFRTLIADDLIAPGKQFGGIANVTSGTNAFNFDGSTAAAVRVSEGFSILGGISHKSIGAYDIGRNGTISGGTTAYDGNVFLFSGQKVLSTILKAEAKPNDDVKITLGWIHNDSRYNTGNYDFTIARGGILKSSERAVNDTFTAAIDWKPGNDLIDLRARLYYNNLTNNTVSDGLISLTGPSNFTFSTTGGSIDNTSRFDTGLGALSLNYGFETFGDAGRTRLQRGFVSQNGTDYSSTLTGGTPGGNREVVSGFASAALKPTDWVTLTGGIRYDWYHLGGTARIYGNEMRDVIGQRMTDPGRPAVCNARGCSAAIPPTYVPIYGPAYYPAYDVGVNRSGGAWLPNFTISFQPTEWLQPFAKYSKSYRPPTVMESFINGGHDSNVINGYAPNPSLRPERGDTYETGFNILANQVFADRDSLRFKAAAFYREITDYISYGYILNSQANRQYDSFVNLDGVTRMKGVEIEANYDARFFYIGGTVTAIDSKFSDSFTSPSGRKIPINSGRGAAVIFEPPKLRVSIDAGVRLFDEKLTIGTRVTDVAATEPALGSLRSGYRMRGYRTFDIYGSYRFNEAATLRFAVNNVTDLAYAPAVGANFYAAPGRTFTASLNLKF